ncbi:hypothetical protein M0R45_005076 [Rubus argutus]|uniref:Uncharacterized protein n=1 Tax=Rubus argutus TaxID=59490 RepID=A0AAW1YLQ0_RUBAR
MDISLKLQPNGSMLFSSRPELSKRLLKETAHHQFREKRIWNCGQHFLGLIFQVLPVGPLKSLKDKILAVLDTGSDYAKYMDEYSSRKAAELPIHIDTQAGRGSESKTLTYLVEESETGR